MGKSFDIGLERLTSAGVPEGKAPASEGGPYIGGQDAGATGSTFYLETFGCQMNDHDSEKVAGKVFSRVGELRPAEEGSGEWRVTSGESGTTTQGAQAGVPVPQEAKHPNQRKIVNAGGGKIIG